MFHDACSELGIIKENPDSSSAMLYNKNRLVDYYANCWAGGKYTLKNGTVLKPPQRSVWIPPNEIFLRPGLVLPFRTGNKLLGAGGRVVAYPSSMRANAGGTAGGPTSQLTFVVDDDNESDLPFGIAACTNGFEIGNLLICGRRWLIGDTYLSTRLATGLILGGNTFPPSGYSYIHDMTFLHCDEGILVDKYKWDAAGSTLCEQGADQSTIERVAFHVWNTCVHFNNEQAVGWSGQDIHVNEPYSWSGEDCVAIWIERGGDIDFKNLIINHRKCTVLKQNTDLPNSGSFNIGKVKWDLQADYSGMYLCLYKWAGSTWSDMSGVNCSLEMGPIDWPRDSGFDASKVIQIPTGKSFPVHKLRFNFHRAPASMISTYFDPLDDNCWTAGSQAGGWYKPKAV